VAIILLLLTSCGGNFTAPQNLDDACSIVAERPSYLKAMQAAERRWGVPVYVQMSMMHAESKFVGNARTPHRYALGVIPMGRQSSAYGYSQAIDGTWDEYKDATGRRWAKRDRITDATDFIGWYIDGTTRELGIAKTDARDQYLAYHEGRRGYANKTYKKKSWLIDIADAVENRADMYHAQLAACGH
jgi:hypothetical protein